MRRQQTFLLPVFIVMSVFCGAVSQASAEDWPMWRFDSARSGQSPQTLPEDLGLAWVRQFPAPKPAYRTRRIQFDAGHEPVVLGKTMYVASSHNDSVTALDTETGKTRWRFLTEGPVRLAPVAWKDRVLFGSDDGHLDCLAAADGRLLWKFRAVPSSRKVLGNGRLISLWPVRGGPVLHQGKVYFAAGVWPFEGIFLYSLDAETGEVVWLNDGSGHLDAPHPQNTQALGGLTPHGYLVVNGGELVVPCGQAVPARFDLDQGRKRLALGGRLRPGRSVDRHAIRSPTGRLYRSPLLCRARSESAGPKGVRHPAQRQRSCRAIRRRQDGWRPQAGHDPAVREHFDERRS